MTKYRAKTVLDREVKGYHFKVKNKHYIILDDAEIHESNFDGEMLYGFVEVKPETLVELRQKNDYARV